MSQLENDMKAQIEAMTGGLNGMVSIMEKQILGMRKSMTPEQAMEFSKQMKESKLDETLEKYKNVSKELRNELNID